MDRNRMTHTDIRELIPQRDPFVMITRLVSVEGRTATSELEVRRENIFVKEGCLQESGLMENMAQTAAALNGILARLEGETVKFGYIGGIKNLKIHSLPGEGSCLTTVVSEFARVMNASVVNCEVHLGGEVIAECEMKLFIQE
jgi:predicted hotdog family 3-hydroxylacyl-ACP dehydratase